MSEASGRRPNRLAGSSSPYLLLHQYNPVDWYPWGREALDRAKSEDKPIFVSVGYSTCYWCHVMERESFSDEDTAELMNRHFVNIKLDREERPDLDEIYMSATQILTGHGGWPNSVFLTPDLEPFFAGTYFPPADRPGLPSFRNVLRSMHDAWSHERRKVEEQAGSVARAIVHHLGDRPAASEEMPPTDLVDRSFASLRRAFDPEGGGFGVAPKFPSPSNLLFLEGLVSEKEGAAELLTTTLDRMARGGIYDQIGGGFHRYATDREWNVPHFEKMLYDNGWLLELYAREFGRSADPQAARVVRETAAFLDRELTSPEGALLSALDAETDGEEGAFYVWSRQELVSILGEEDFGFLAPLLGFAGAPFFEERAYVLHLPERLERQAERRRMELEELVREIDPLRRKLLRARSARRRPLTDDKVLTDWNGTAISGLAEGGRLLGEVGLVEQAARAAEFVLTKLRPDGGTLRHAWREGRAYNAALLADYAYLVRGLLSLYRSTGEDRWLASARELSAEQANRLSDPEGGFFVAAAGDDLLVRSRDLFDGAMPAPNAVAVLNLLDLAELDAANSWMESAEEALRAFAPVMLNVPDATRTLALAVRRVHRDAGTVPLPGAAGNEPDRDATSDVVRARLRTVPDEAGRFAIEIEIAPGWHIYGDGGGEAGMALLPLRLEGRGAVLSDIEMPMSAAFLEGGNQESGGAVRIYSGTIVVTGRARATGERPRLALTFQACDDCSCLAPSELVLELGLDRQ